MRLCETASKERNATAGSPSAKISLVQGLRLLRKPLQLSGGHYPSLRAIGLCFFHGRLSLRKARKLELGLESKPELQDRHGEQCPVTRTPLSHRVNLKRVRHLTECFDLTGSFSVTHIHCVHLVIMHMISRFPC